MKAESHIGGLHVDDIVTFYTRGGARSVTGLVTKLHLGRHQHDYASVYMDVDGMEYCFGTGGHLGDSWTTESGMEEWFVEIVKRG